MLTLVAVAAARPLPRTTLEATVDQAADIVLAEAIRFEYETLEDGGTLGRQAVASPWSIEYVVVDVVRGDLKVGERFWVAAANPGCIVRDFVVTRQGQDFVDSTGASFDPRAGLPKGERLLLLAPGEGLRRHAGRWVSGGPVTPERLAEVVDLL